MHVRAKNEAMLLLLVRLFPLNPVKSDAKSAFGSSTFT